MGIFLNLDIVPNRISAEDWASVYKESLVLLEQYPFLSKSRAENGYFYAERARHQKSVFDEFPGWYVEGDMRTGSNMEEFSLADNIDYYRGKGTQEPDDREVLFCCLYGNRFDVDGPDAACVWANKTQGKPAHLYLLAIGCLICHRFPRAAIVYGDISSAQCQEAVEWANQYLETPIDIPVTADMRRLLPRLKESGLPEKDLLPVFYQLTLESRHEEMGACLKESLPPHLFENYYKNDLLPYSREDGTLYLKRFSLKEYLELGLDFKTLCRMVMVDPDGNQLAPRDFMRALLEMKLHVPLEENVLHDFAASPKDMGIGGVETVDSLLFKAWLIMKGGRNNNVAAYLSLEQISAVFEAVLGAGEYLSMAEELMEEIRASVRNENQDTLYDGPDSQYKQLMDKWTQEEDVPRNYDIEGRDEVIDYREGDSVEPKLHASLINYVSQVRKIGEKVFKDVVQALDEDARKKLFHKYYCVLIPKEIEDMFFARIMDDEFIVRYAGLYFVEVTDGLLWVIRGFLWNPELLNHYWELAEDVKETQ